MKAIRLIFASALLAAFISAPVDSQGQVPPHQPGTVCLTPYFWCWMSRPGIVGAPCSCFTPSGPVPGTTGATREG